MEKTSHTHPLRIDEVPVANAGVIGITFCPGKTDLLARQGPWRRDLALDMDTIRAWQPLAVVTLITSAEFELLAVPELPSTMQAEAFEWHHLPIVDRDIPAADFEDRWVSVEARLSEQLAEGGRILVHCRGGLGRAGLVAARLLIKSGETPTSAVQRVRAARSGTIETAAQEDYVLRQKTGKRRTL
jgi:protein-tyrosine phosphatase